MLRATIGCLGAALLFVPLGCGGGEEAAPEGGAASPAAETSPRPKAPAEGDAAAGAALFASRCASCHGPAGAGDGPAAAGLTPSPRDFGDPAWQDSVSDEHIRQVISYGGAAVGLSPIMPAQPDLANQPEQLAALTAYVRSLRR